MCFACGVCNGSISISNKTSYTRNSSSFALSLSSSYSSTSRWNEHGNYGSSYGWYSAFNSNAFTPPTIKRNSVVIGYLTTNLYKTSCFNYYCLTARIDPRSLIFYIKIVFIDFLRHYREGRLDAVKPSRRYLVSGQAIL